VPVPFEYVQLNAYQLNTMSLLCPLAISAVTPSLVLAIAATFVIVGSFYAIFIVANDMEDPFGNQLNDMPMLSYHEEFCASIYAMLSNPWLPEDQWLVKDGGWVDPSTVTKTATALWDTIGQREKARALNRGKPQPYASLLNNHKKANVRPPRSTELDGPIRRMFSRVYEHAFLEDGDSHRLPHILNFPGELGSEGFDRTLKEKKARAPHAGSRSRWPSCTGPTQLHRPLPHPIPGGD